LIRTARSYRVECIGRSQSVSSSGATPRGSCGACLIPVRSKSWRRKASAQTPPENRQRTIGTASIWSIPPGYGTANFPGDTYAERFKIREFDLFLCVFDGKLHQDDTRLFRFLKETGKVCLFVRNKRDGIWEEGKTIEELEASIVEDVAHQVGSPHKVYFTSCRTTYGLDALEDAITETLHDAKRERWYRSAQAFSEAFLKKKRQQCEVELVVAAGLAAGNALNPVPGLETSPSISASWWVSSREYATTTVLPIRS
jgi:interferon-inducible GTPase IIGP